MTDAPAAAPALDPAPPDTSGVRPQRSIKFNFMVNVAGAVIPLGVSLITVPIYIRHIGDARYGVLSIVWVLLGYLGFLDFGLSRAAVRSLARRKDSPQEERAQVLVTTMVLNLCLGLLGSVVLATLGSYLLQHVLSVPDTLRPEVARALPWIVVLFPLALVGGVGIGTLESRERFGLANVLSVSGTAAGQILPVVLAVIVGPSLAIVIPAAVLVRATTVVVVLGAVWRQERPLSLRHIHRTKARELLSYGSWVTVSGVISPILVSLDQFVIGGVLGIAAVAYYIVPMNLVTRSQVFAAALSRTLFPRLSSVSRDEARWIALRALSLVAVGYGAVCATAIVMTPLFFRVWVDPGFAAVAAPIAQILFMGAWVNGVALVPFSFLQGQGRVDLTGKLHALEVVPFLAMLWLAAHAYGLKGAAVVWVLRCAVDMILLALASGLLGQAFLRLTGVGLMLVAAALFAWCLSPPPFVSGVAALVFGCAIVAFGGGARPAADQLRMCWSKLHAALGAKMPSFRMGRAH